MRTFFSFDTPAMRRIRFSLLIGLLAGSMLLLAGCDSGGSNGSSTNSGDGDDSPDSGTSGSTVTELTVNTDKLSTLENAVKAANLDDDLSADDKTFTVFAPVNSAFSNIEIGDLTGDDALLKKVLTYHVVSGKEIKAGDISDGQTESTLQGGDLTFNVESDGTVKVNGATVTKADIEASNGVVHLIDGALLKQTNAVERATIASSFSILQKLVGEANLGSTLSGPGPDGEDGITVFAPTNNAFLTRYDDDDSGTIENDEIPPNAGNILKYHVLDDVFFASDVPTSETDVPTLEGSNATVVRSGSDVTINPNDDNASVVTPNVDVSNGVIHGIDTVLIP